MTKQQQLWRNYVYAAQVDLAAAAMAETNGDRIARIQDAQANLSQAEDLLEGRKEEAD